MISTTKASPPTTLQRLQALGKQSSTLDEKLDQIELILKDVTICSSQFLTSRNRDSHRFKHHGRAEWATRWAVDKLHGDTLEAKEARSNVRMWYLIRNLVDILPPAVAARTLNSQTLLTAVVFAFKELVSETRQGSQHTNVDKGSKEQWHTSVTEDSKLIQSSKRKLSDEGDHVKGAKRQKLDGDQSGVVRSTQSHPRGLYHAILACLKTVERRATATTLGSFRHEQLTSALRTTPSTAAQILGSWFRIQTLLLQHGGNVSYEDSADDMTQIFRIWNSRILAQQEDSNLSSGEFSTECLLPATLFLEILRNVRITPGSDAWNTVRSTERLIAKHVLLPARRDFFTHQSNGADPARSDSYSWKLLHPLLGSQHSQDVGTNQTRCLAVSRLFGLAVRCCPLNTPRKKVSESKWLNHLFSNLAACISRETPDKDSNTPTFTDLDPLRLMLQIAIEQGISIDHSSLVTIILKHSGLMTAEDRIDWSIIAQILRLDSSVFIGDRLGKSGDVTDHKLLKSLCSSITDRIWTTLCGDRQLEYENVRSNIIETLLRASASSRQLPLFLDFWRRQLSDIKSNQHAKFVDSFSDLARLSVWEDYVIIDTLSEVITTAMTSQRVQEYVAILGTAFEKTMAPEQHDYHPCGDISLLALLLQSFEDYDLLQKLQPLLSQLFASCITALDEHNNNKNPMSVTVWKLSLIIHHQLTRIGKSFATKQDVKHLVKIACNKVKHIDESRSSYGLEELVAMLTATQGQIKNLRAKNLLDDEDRGWSTQLEEEIFQFSQQSSSSAMIEALKLIVATTPTSLHSKLGDTDESSKIPDMLSQWSISAHQSSSTWKLLVERSIDANANSIQAILGALHNIQSLVAVAPQQLSNEQAFRFLSTTYSYIPPVIVPRWQREQFVDMSISFLCGLDVFEKYESFVWVLSGVIRLLRAPCGNARLIKNARHLYDMARHVDKIFGDRLPQVQVEPSIADLLDLLECLASHVFSSRFTVNDATGFGETVKVFEEETKDLFGRKVGIQEPAMLRVLSSGIQVVASISKRFCDSDSSWQNIQAKVCTGVCDQLTSIGKDHQSSEKGTLELARLVGVELLRLLTVIEDGILAANESLLRQSIKGYDEMNTLVKPIRNQRMISERVLQYKLNCKIESAQGKHLNIPMSINELAAANPTEHIVIRNTAMSGFQIMNPQQKGEAFQAILQEVRTSREATESLELLRIAMRALISHPQGMETYISEGIVLSCERLVVTKELQQFNVLSNILSMTKDVKAKDISQSAVDAIQLALLSMVSASAPSLPPQAAGIIFSRLCNITRSILSTHRRKLRGRFGSLAHILRSLLRCLFMRVGASESSVSGTAKQPAWLSAEFPLDRQHATGFARLLMMVCEPTTSSVASSKSAKPRLTDETIRARVYAGQYVSYVLMEYCDSQLHGRLPDSGMREQLMPGLYAACSVVELAGVQEATMSALSAPARVGLKELWESWRKFGRWDGA